MAAGCSSRSIRQISYIYTDASSKATLDDLEPFPMAIHTDSGHFAYPRCPPTHAPSAVIFFTLDSGRLPVGP
eukprot:1407070-Pleurochrysis_carterae.AAC.4